MPLNFIRIYLFLYLTLISIISYSQIDQEKRDTSFNNEKYQSIMSYIDTISNPANFVNISWYIWTNRDGAIGSEISNNIANAILKYPDLIFAKFNNNPVSFNNWVVRLPYDLFTDYAGTRIHALQKLKKDLINALLNYKNRSDLKKYSQIIDLLYNRILVVQVRNID